MIKPNNPTSVKLISLLIVVFLIAACHQAPKNTAHGGPSNPVWSVNANIYEVNVRQFTPEGTFNAFAEHLPRLQKMGVDILWLMPIHPIGQLNRKGSLGSYYSVKNYLEVNPEFGTLDDFKALVEKAHDLGMRVIIDWVANHTAWDSDLITNHPEWYTRDEKGNFISPYDWSDVADLNFESNQPLWDYMLDALKYWVREADIDGYRCDVAFMVPTEFWNRARNELEAIKPVFMLAEAEEPEHHTKAFDMSYAWNLHRVMNQIGKKQADANTLDSMLMADLVRFPSYAYRMQFTSNHDENSWNGTEYERLGEGAKAFAVWSATVPGMPLIYNGQESAFNRRLAFFEKDQIDWAKFPLEDFYRELLLLKKNNQALWNGIYGGSYERITTDADTQVYAFVRVKDKHKVFVILNLSDQPTRVTLAGKAYTGKYKALFDQPSMRFRKGATIEMTPWEYRVYHN